MRRPIALRVLATALLGAIPVAATLAQALGFPEDLARRVYPRVLDKLKREAVEDLRIDFEDGYGARPDAEEDGHAMACAREAARGHAGAARATRERRPAVRRRNRGPWGRAAHAWRGRR